MQFIYFKKFSSSIFHGSNQRYILGSQQVDLKNSFVTKLIVLIFLLKSIWMLPAIRLNIQSKIPALPCRWKALSRPGLGSIQYVHHLNQVSGEKGSSAFLEGSTHNPDLGWFCTQSIPSIVWACAVCDYWLISLCKSMLFIFIPPSPQSS